MPLLHQVDAFTSEPFRGNPAAVCLLDAPADAAWMQSVAAEMNLAETAFVVPEPDGFGLRWFTPTVEVDLCGHATLASAHTLWNVGALDHDAPARFHTRSGLLTCVRAGDLIEMDFPATPVVREPEIDPDLFAAIGITPIAVSRGPSWYLVELATEADLVELAPDLALLGTLEGVHGATVTAPASRPDADFVSRVFGPAVGIPEDPVTGSAHCSLAPYWAAKLGRTELVGYQASSRGGFVRCRLEGNRVILGGEAVTVLRGELTVPA